jgi:hypothetical protein
MIVVRFHGYLSEIKALFDYGSVQVGGMGELPKGILGRLGGETMMGQSVKKLKLKKRVVSCEIYT